jgi:hypothetical protein
MSSSTLLAVATATLCSLPTTAALAAPDDPLACSVAVEHRVGGALRFSYAKDFTVSPTAPFSDDFSTATRFRTIDASVTVADGTPEVVLAVEADVDAFNSAGFEAALAIHDRSGVSTAGRTSFAGAVGSHRITYTLTCSQPTP